MQVYYSCLINHNNKACFHSIQIIRTQTFLRHNYTYNHYLILIFQNNQHSSRMIPYIFLGLAVVFVIIYFVTKGKQSSGQGQQGPKIEDKMETKEKVNYGQICIFFGSQTGTAAKLAEQLGEQATENGFEPVIVDLKNVAIDFFEGLNKISIFLLSNTGQGDPPDNTVKFMNILKGKQSIDDVKEMPWGKMNFTVFGLGNTQYEHYNQTGRVADRLLEKNGANRIYVLGEGDDNCSLEDDFMEWRKNLWTTLIQFRKNHHLKVSDEIHVSNKTRKLSSDAAEAADKSPLTAAAPLLVNYRIFFNDNNKEQTKISEDFFDFKTKASLKAEVSEVKAIRELRENHKDGSTLEIELQLPGKPEYSTAGNIALYAKNDPNIVKEVMEYFKIEEKDLDRKISLAQIYPEKKIKLNFVPNTLRTLLEQSIDLQGKLTKSVLKKLSKFKSKNPEYFAANASPKTTEEYKRITEKGQGHWYNLIKIVKQHEVEMTFVDFVDLCDSMAPRLFTIASHYHTENNVVIAASLIENGLISKFFLTKPQYVKTELRKSTFTASMDWKKVIYIAAGTGLAPFRGFIQEKVYNLELKKQGKQANVPIITLFFGCRHQHGDFIYKDEIIRLRDIGIINRLHLAFSRDSEKKVYVQDLLQKEQAELTELGHCKETAIYICGSLPMGASIIDVLTKKFGAEHVKQMEKEGRIIKQLW